MTDDRSVGVPFQSFDNRRGLTLEQVLDSPELYHFVRRFEHCFEWHPEGHVLLFIEADDPRSAPDSMRPIFFDKPRAAEARTQ